jgi:hypothetical protein
MKKMPLAFFSLFVLSAMFAFPQGSFLKPGQHGLGVSGALSTNSDFSGVSGTFTYTAAGIFDFSFSLGHAAYGASSSVADLKANSYVPEIRAYVLKQNSGRSPVTLSVSLGWVRNNYSSPDLDEGSLEMWDKSLLLGAAVHRDVPLFKKAYIQPFVGVTHASTKLTVTDTTTGLASATTDAMLALNLGVPLVYGLSDKAMLIVQPGVSFDKNNTTFSISAGLVYALSKPKITS